MRLTTVRTLLRSSLLLLAALTAPFATSQTNTGTIVGTARDNTGGTIPGATVTTRNLGTGEVRTVTTDGDGDFTIPNLQIGHYSVTVTREGFPPAQIADTELQVAQRETINPVLQIGAVNDKVTIIADQVPHRSNPNYANTIKNLAVRAFKPGESPRANWNGLE